MAVVLKCFFIFLAALCVFVSAAIDDMNLWSVPSNQFHGKAIVVCQLRKFDEFNNNFILINARDLHKLKPQHIQKSLSAENDYHYILIDNVTLNNRYSIAFYTEYTKSGKTNTNIKLLGLSNIDVNKTSISLHDDRDIYLAA